MTEQDDTWLALPLPDVSDRQQEASIGKMAPMAASLVRIE